jgi:hypothetical protein
VLGLPLLDPEVLLAVAAENQPLLERAALVLSFLAHAYVWVRCAFFQRKSALEDAIGSHPCLLRRVRVQWGMLHSKHERFHYTDDVTQHLKGESPPSSVLPAVLAVPLHAVGAALHRPPLLTYASYNLHNWRRLDPTLPVALGNTCRLFNFYGGMDEEHGARF